MSKALVVKPISLIIHMQANLIESLKMFILIYFFYEIKSICDFFLSSVSYLNYKSNCCVLQLIKTIITMVTFYSQEMVAT